MTVYFSCKLVNDVRIVSYPNLDCGHAHCLRGREVNSHPTVLPVQGGTAVSLLFDCVVPEGIQKEALLLDGQAHQEHQVDPLVQAIHQDLANLVHLSHLVAHHFQADLANHFRLSDQDHPFDL